MNCDSGQLATPGHTRILLLGRFRVKEDADFLTLARERFGFRVCVSEYVRTRTGLNSSAASYQLIELLWSERSTVPEVTPRVSQVDTRSEANNREPDAVASETTSVKTLASSPTDNGCNIDGSEMVLKPHAFHRLQQALVSATWQQRSDNLD